MIQVVGVAVLGAVVGMQSPDPRTILQDSAAAMAGVNSAVYDARLEMTGSATQRIVTGHVALERSTSNPDTLLGGKVAVRGEVGRGSEESEKFELTFDGKTLRRYQALTKSMLQADIGRGAEGLIQGPYGGLILRELLGPNPLAAELAAQLSYAGRSDVNGKPADVVEVALADGTVTRWSIDAADRLPRRMERTIRSSSGRDVKWDLTLDKLEINVAIDPGTYRIAAQDQASTRVQVMGAPPPKAIAVGDAAPDWTLKDGEGHEHKLSDYRGKLVVLDFWASWCPHCKEAMPSMQKIHERYAERGVAVLGVNCRERGPVDAAAFVREKGFTYQVLVDASGEVAPMYRVKGIPAFFVVGPDGKILLADSGFNSAKETVLLGVIEQHLAGSS